MLHFSFTCNPDFYFNVRKSYEETYHSLTHVSVITGNILITIIIFVRYHLRLASTISFMTDSMHLGIIHICLNLSENYLYLIFLLIRDLINKCILLSIAVAEYAAFSDQVRTLKTNILDVI